MQIVKHSELLVSFCANLTEQEDIKFKIFFLHIGENFYFYGFGIKWLPFTFQFVCSASVAGEKKQDKNFLYTDEYRRTEIFAQIELFMLNR